jgi:hypothetical protein
MKLGAHGHAAAAAHRQQQLAGALQGDVKAVVEGPCLLAIELRQRHMHPARIQSNPVPASKAAGRRTSAPGRSRCRGYR